MANFPRVKPLGWSLFDILASALMNQLDIDHSKTFNADDGSSHAPLTQIVIRGAGLKVQATIDITTSGIELGRLNIAGLSELHVQAGGFMIVDNLGEVDVVSGGQISMANGSAFVLAGAQTVTSIGKIDVQSATGINIKTGAKEIVESGGSLEANGALGIVVKSGGKITVNSGGTAQLDGDVTLTANFIKSGNVAIECQRVGAATAADGTYQVTKDIYKVPGDLGGGASWLYTLKSTSPAPPQGATLWFSRTKASAPDNGVVAFYREDATFLGQFNSSVMAAIAFYFGTDNKWHVLMWSANITLIGD